MEPLLIDRAAAAERPRPEALAEWAAQQRVFVSSVIEGYSEPRNAAVAAIEKLGASAVWFERFGGRDSDPNRAYLDEVRSSDIYVGLLGARYGRPLPSRFSATHEEYREAERHWLRLSVWAEQGINREGPQQSFLEEVRQFNVIGRFASPGDLAEELERRLKDIAAEDLSPWCKLGRLVFRARQITERAQGVRIEATLKDPRVAEALGALNERFGRHEQLLTYGGRTLVAHVGEVEMTTRATRSRDVVINAAVAEPPQRSTYTFNGVSWDDMTDLAIKVSILGQPNPLGLMSGQAEIRNPLPEIVAAGVSAEALRVVSELALTEILVTERGVARVLRLRLGAAIGGQRALQLEWLPASRYGEAAQPRLLQGEVEL
ncbi:MAG: hypothetical protein QOD83_3263 [Solirubrobacteraceae bacterium]|nr:hypothetical protein [Solirubrobacteraceae bacterium]